MQKKQSGVIYVDRSGFSLYEKTLPKIIAFPFQPNTVASLDILDRELLGNQIKQFITLNKVKPTTLIMILSTSVLFEKILPEIDEQQKLDEVKKFLENMPFENVSTITYKLEKGYRIIAMNRDFHDVIKQAFELEGFTIGAVVPVFSLGKGIDMSRGINEEIGKLVLKKFDSVRPENYVLHRSEGEVVEENNVIVNFGKKNKRLSVLLIIFILLIIVLIVAIIMSFQTPENKKGSAVTAPTTIPAPTATPTIAIEESSGSPSASIKAGVTIQIFYRPGNLESATNLRNKLNSLGFNNIEIGSPQSTAASNTLVIFSTNVPQEVRDEVTTELESLYKNIVSRQNDNTLFDITITLAQ
ncbi:MAG: hypothetical protein HYT11_01700 [Candidatus Levybacteria bacterium]|nr:hypothetical protein [Candidatus Levybacteria bacterium]